MVDSMDQGIGRIVAALKRQDTLDNTLILFLQDNGGCAEGMGRGAPRNAPIQPTLHADGARTSCRPNMIRRSRPATATRCCTGPGVMPGPADTYIGYGRGWANVSNTPFPRVQALGPRRRHLARR